MSLAVCARGFPNFVFPLGGHYKVENYISNQENYESEPCIASTFERVDELTPILNSTNDVKNAFLSTCEVKVERDNQEHIYYISEEGDRLDVTALFRVGKFYLSL